MAQTDGQEEGEYVQEEEVTTIPGWAPSVSLEVKDTVETGEENEEELYSQRSKLFRFRDGEWKERGLGEAKLLKHKGNGKVRFILRQEKTMKIVANHIVIKIPPYCVLRLNQGSEKCWVWSAQDYSEDEPCVDQFALKFANIDLAGKFKEAFENATQLNANLEPTVKEGTAKDDAKPGAEAQEKKEEASDAGEDIKAKNGAAEGSAKVSAPPSPEKSAEPASAEPPNPFAGMSFSLAGAGSSSGGLFTGAASSSGLFSGGLFGASSEAAAASSGGGLFGSSAATGGEAKPAAEAAQQDEEHEYVVEEEVTNIPGWAPTVSLEVKDHVETGEEGEEELYTQRSKLYRFRDGEWKERGLGEARLLRHKETKKVRFMLRQEKTMKIVANHFVIKMATYCDLRPNMGSNKCWVWTAHDYAEEESAVEQFALKFGSEELANKFRDAFNDAKEQNSKLEGFEELAGIEGEEVQGDKDTSAAPGQSDAKDSKEDTAAADSKDAKGAAEPEKPQEATNLFAGSSLFSAGTSSSLAPAIGGLFAPPARSDQSGGASQGLFGSLFSSTAGATGGSLFGGSSSGGLFGSSTTGGLFGSAASSGGGGLFGAAAALPVSDSQAESQLQQAAEQGQDDEYVAEEEVVNIPGWAPSVSLEVQDVVETGEEGEEELYTQRSKLYRFRDGEWKERGLGDAKLLKHKESGKVRFMLRQEKTMKIVANHYVIGMMPYCDLQPNAGSQKCWVWLAQDCSEEEMVVERLALKFGAVETAQAFKEAFENAKELNSSVPEFAKMSAGEGSAQADAKPANAAGQKEAPKATGSEEKPKPPAEEKPNPLFSATRSQPAPEVSGTTAGSSLFGGGATGGLFGASSGSATGLFGTSVGGLFGGGSSGTSSGGLFGGASSGGSSGGLFGSISSGLFSGTGSSTGLFSSTGSGLFSGASSGSSTGSSTGLFSGASSGSSGLFCGVSSSLFGASANGAATAATTQTAANGESGAQQADEDLVVEDEVTSVPGFVPSLTLEVKDTVETGEENETELYSQRSKLLRFRDGEWKERGTGEAKLLRHKQTGKVRFLLRQEKTMKIVANFVVINQAPYCQLKPNAGSQKCWVWTALDWADGEQVVEQFALKFGSAELAAKFQEVFNSTKEGGSAAPSAAPAAKPSSAAKAPAAPPAATQQAPAWSPTQWQSWEGYDNEDDGEGYEDYYNYPDDNGDVAPVVGSGQACGTGGSLAWMAEQQNKNGWRCSVCRLQYGDEVFECGVCEIPRPGFEDQAKEKQAEKAKGLQSAAAAFLGTSAAATTSKAPAPTGFTGFGTGFAAPAAVAKSQAFNFASASDPAEATTASSGSIFANLSTDGFKFGAPSSSTPSPPVFGVTAPPAGTGVVVPPVMKPPQQPVLVPPPAKAMPAATPNMAPTNAAGWSFGVAQPPPPPLSAAAPAAAAQPPPPSVGFTAPQQPAPAAASTSTAAPEATSGKFDSALVAAAVEASMAAVLKATGLGSSADGAGNDSALRKAEEQVRRLEDQARESREREAGDRARRAEQELESLRQQLRRKEAEDGETVRRLHAQQAEDRSLLESLRGELRQEREARARAPAPQAAESAAVPSQEMLQSVLKVAEGALKVAENAQQAVLQLREESKSETCAVAERMEALEDRFERRLEAWESGLERRSDAMKSLPAGAGSGIAHLQGLHQRQTGRRMLGGHENAMIGAAEPNRESKGAVGPLLRRHF